jgi:aspartate aminotransferase
MHGVMPIARNIRASIESSSWIRKMFEEGIVLAEQYGAENVFDFSLGNPDLEPPPEFCATLIELASSTAPGSHGYMPNAGYPEVRAAIAKKASREHKVELSGSDVVMCVGAAGGLNVVMKTLLDPGDEVLTVRPYFVEYGAYVQNHGGVLRAVEPTADFSLDPASIAQALTPRTAAVLINSPNNPTGRLYPESTLISLAEVLSAHAKHSGRCVFLVVDEPYRDLVYAGRVTPPVLCHYPDSIAVNSFSKSLSLPGERIGYIAVNPACHDAANLMAGLAMCNRSLGFVNAPALMQRAVAKLIDSKVDVTPYNRRRELLVQALRASGIAYAEPDGAFYLFCKSPIADDVAFVQFLKDRRILVVPGVGFGYPGWFRLCYAVADVIVERAIPVLRQAMEEWNAQKR